MTEATNPSGHIMLEVVSYKDILLPCIKYLYILPVWWIYYLYNFFQDSFSSNTIPRNCM